ncbi:MAG: prepilin-type N-terminal cleavage/methylation domain-containing protein [Kistimonas sp.]|nr:prepilin-type N-terminal cleavage/methylation domain-containing protein [Kistimonas sp.]
MKNSGVATLLWSGRAHNARGFSLVELMVAVAIVGIILAFAVPSLRDYMLRAGRSDAHVALQRMAAAQERVYAQQSRYTDVETQLGGNLSPEGLYTLSAVTGLWNGTDCSTATSDPDSTHAFTLIAQPTAAASQAADADCTCIYMDSLGSRYANGAAAGGNSCWGGR